MERISEQARVRAAELVRCGFVAAEKQQELEEYLDARERVLRIQLSSDARIRDAVLRLRQTAEELAEHRHFVKDTTEALQTVLRFRAGELTPSTGRERTTAGRDLQDALERADRALRSALEQVESVVDFEGLRRSPETTRVCS